MTRPEPLSSDDSKTSLSLLQRVKNRDPEAWSKFVELYTPAVYCWCRRAGVRSNDAADIGQEVFQAVARSIGRFRRDRPSDSFRGWLRTITRNKIRDFFRTKRAEAGGGSSAQQALLRVPFDGDSETDAPVTVGEETAELKLLCQRAVELMRAEFEERTWQAFWRVVVEEQSVAKVAAELGITANAVYLAKSRILRRLKTEFAGLVDM